MGNYKFRFSSMIPNSWFYKLKDSTTSNKITRKPPLSTGTSSSFQSPSPADGRRKSYYFTRDLQVQDSSPPKTRPPDPPRKSSKKRRQRTPKKHIHRNLVTGELSSAGRSSYRVSPESVSTESNSSDTENPSPELSLTCSCKTNSSYDDVYGKVDLPPIITKPAKQDEFGSGKWVIDGGSGSLSVKVVKEDNNGVSKTRTRSPGRKMKGNSYSPRIGNRIKVQGINGGRRSGGNRRSLSVSESMAVVKTSVDPGRDFKESMVEMIMENNIRGSKDLEDLLACYLSLNSDEYHDLIIKVFKQIWFESINY